MQFTDIFYIKNINKPETLCNNDEKVGNYIFCFNDKAEYINKCKFSYKISSDRKKRVLNKLNLIYYINNELNVNDNLINKDLIGLIYDFYIGKTFIPIIMNKKHKKLFEENNTLKFIYSEYILNHLNDPLYGVYIELPFKNAFNDECKIEKYLENNYDLLSRKNENLTIILKNIIYSKFLNNKKINVNIYKMNISLNNFQINLYFKFK